MEMSSNAAARLQLKNIPPVGKPPAQDCSRPNLSDVTKQLNNADTDLQTDRVMKTKLILPQSNTAVVKPQSISVSAMEQLFSGLREKSKSAPASVDTPKETEAKVPDNNSNHPSLRVNESNASDGLNMIKSKLDHTPKTSEDNRNITASRTQDHTCQTIKFSSVTSPVSFSVTGVDQSQHQTVQNYCHNLYQGVNLYGNPMTPQLPAQQWPFLQPLIGQQVPTVPYQLPSYPCLPYQPGYPATVTGQAPSWTYIPAAEHQYPLNLSLQDQTATQKVSQLHVSVGGSKATVSEAVNQSDNTGSFNSQIHEQKSAVSEEVETQLKRHCTTLNAEIDATSQKKLKLESPIEPKNITKVQSELKSNFHTYITKSDTGQTVLVPTAANSVVVDSVRAKVKSDLQALTDLTLGVGKDTSQESRIFLGAGMKDTNDKIQHADSGISAYNVLDSTITSKETTSTAENNEPLSQSITTAGSPMTYISPSPSKTVTKGNPLGRSGEIIYIDRNRKRLSLSSFPYSQEIRIPDGTFIKLKGDTVAMKPIGHVQAQSAGGSVATSSAGVQSHVTGKTVKELLQLQNLNSNTSLGQTKPLQGMRSASAEERGFKKDDIILNGSQLTSSLNMTKAAISMTKAEGVINEMQKKQTEDHEVSEDSNITVEIKQSDKPTADNKEVRIKQAKQRSQSDSICSPNLCPSNVIVDGERQPFQRFRNRNLKSEGDFPAETNKSDKMQDQFDNVKTNEMVHVLGTNKLVTVKVSKYPNLCISSRPTYVSPEPGTKIRRDGNILQNNPLHIKVGKSPIIKSTPRESSCLSLEERQYLEQIQHFPKNQCTTSSLAQLLMKDMKKDGNVKKETQDNQWSANDCENVNPDTELVVGRQLNLHLQTKEEHMLSCSDIGQATTEKVKIDRILNENDKSTNTWQDDEVFSENEQLYE